MNFENKTILITGVNRGIGEALVREALKRGVRKIYGSVRTLSLMPDFADERVQAIELDITDVDQVAHAAKVAHDTQILFNNAGVLSPGNILEGDLEKIKYDMDVNYFGTLNMMRAFVPVLEKNSDAKIVNIASIVAYSNLPLLAGYSASKAALYSATQAARIELSKKGIAVHAVNPGAIDTDMNKGSEMEMTSPADVATSILDEIENEKLDIIPDKIGRGMFELWNDAPIKLHDAFRDFYFSAAE